MPHVVCASNGEVSGGGGPRCCARTAPSEDESRKRSCRVHLQSFWHMMQARENLL